jgi:hypothetical protein
LGNELARAIHRRLPDEKDFLALCELAWFRKGWMPDDLRRRLGDDLVPRHRETVRAAIEQFLFNGFNEPTLGKQRPTVLELAPSPDNWRPVLRAWLRRAAQEGAVTDEVFLCYMLGRKRGRGELRLDRQMAHLLGTRLLHIVDTRTIVGFILAVTASFWLSSFVREELASAPRVSASAGAVRTPGFTDYLKEQPVAKRDSELIKQLSDPDKAIVAAAAHALGQLGDKQAAPELIKLLYDQDSAVRATVATALGQLGDKQVVPELVKLLHDQDPAVRATVATALGQLGDKQAAPELIKLLHDQDPAVRATAATALGQLGDKQKF